MQDFYDEEFEDIEIIRADEYNDVEDLDEDEEDEIEGGASTKTKNITCSISHKKKSVTVKFPYKILSASWKNHNRYAAFSKYTDKIIIKRLSGSNPIPRSNSGVCSINVFCKDKKGCTIRYIVKCILEAL